MHGLALTIDAIGLIEVVAVGLVAGILGGMLGIGGSVVMIPGLTIILGPAQHLYQAAAMIANVAVSLPAAIRHRRAGKIVPAALKMLIPITLAFVLLGVFLSNMAVFTGEGEIWLRRVFAAFLVYVIFINVRKLRGSGASDESESHALITAPRCTAVGGAMGTTAGLLGIGGGAIAVPLQQVLLKLPLRNCIATSSAIICVSAAVGATVKTATLEGHGYAWTDALLIAAALSPSCIIGGFVGAALTHKLPLRWVRLAFIGLMVVAGWKMSGIAWPWQWMGGG